MTRFVRYTLDPSLPYPAPDGRPGVIRGTLSGDEVVSEADGTRHALSAVRLLPPVSPTKIVCVGRNYADHAKELGNEVPSEPLIFLKPPSSLNAHGAPILYPPISRLVHFEGELGVVIGKRAWQVSEAEAQNYVAGYTVVNDVTARDLQRKDVQFTRGKGFDTFCPCGPYWVPANEVDFDTLRVRTLVDGVVKQDAPVTDMLFPVRAIIAFVTQFMTLEPGDLIATGTPPGVGPVNVGSTVTVEIPGIGKLENPVIAA